MITQSFLHADLFSSAQAFCIPQVLKTVYYRTWVWSDRCTEKQQVYFCSGRFYKLVDSCVNKAQRRAGKGESGARG